MTASTEPSNKLLPCPFCGARARFEINDECWEWVECSGCGIQGNRSASLMEGCKPKLAEAWNRRAQVVGHMAKALKTIIELNLQYCIDKYGDASKAESMECVRVARAALAAAPQPPEATVNDSLTVEAAPVQLPEPDFWIVDSQRHGREFLDAAQFKMRSFDAASFKKLYTEHQVRQLLAEKESK